MKLDVITFGEPLFMFYANETGKLEDVSTWSSALAGAETNVATGLSRLGHKTGFVTKLGNDSFGRFIKKTMEQENIDTSNIKVTNEQSTGMYLKGKADVGDPNIEYFREDSAASQMNLNDFDESYFEKAKLLHFTSIFAGLSESNLEFSFHVTKRMREMGKLVTFDPNIRLDLWDKDFMIKTINQFAENADIITPGYSEAQLLTGYESREDIAKFYLNKGVKLVVLTEAEGAFYATNTESEFIPGYQVKVVDTVGAGDAFTVGLISAILEGLSIKEAVLRGNATGGRQVTFKGDNDGLPSREELKQFMLKTERL
jgi:2-dehydro-3-deoxygluconokinase